MDFAAQQRARYGVLWKAQNAGFDSDSDRSYITGVGSGTFRGVRYQDTKVREAVEAHEADMAIIQPYYAIRNTYEFENPEYRDIARQIKLLPLGSEKRNELEQDPVYKCGNQQIANARQALRLDKDNNNIDEAGVRWGMWKPIEQTLGGAGRIPAGITIRR